MCHVILHGAAIWDVRYVPLRFEELTPFNGMEIGYAPVTPYGSYAKMIQNGFAGQSLGCQIPSAQTRLCNDIVFVLLHF